MKTPAPEEIQQAVDVLRKGGVIAMPTDTLYALTAPALDAAAIHRVFEIKGREEGKALPLFVTDVEMAEGVADLDQRARRLARRFWPGGLTIVVRVKPDFQSEALAGGDTVALRVPDNAIAREVIAGAGQPVTATSANLSRGPNPVSADEVRRQLAGRLDLILDAGPAVIGVASTVVDCSGGEIRVLRDGAIARELLEEALQD